MPQVPGRIDVLALTSLPDGVIDRMCRIDPGIVVHRLKRADARFGEVLPEAQVVIGGLSAEEIGQAKSLRWMQLGSAGANRYVDALPAEVILTNATGVFGVPIAEHVLALMLALTRGIPEAVRAAAETRWSQAGQREELYGKTCGILGLGDIGTELARRAKGLGMRVLAVKRSLVPKPAFVDELWDLSGLDWLLSQSDHVVNCLPGTPHTQHLIDERRIGRMVRGARFYNVGRGSTVDEAALVAALQAGHLAGAGLDVFEQEPLPASSPLWRMANVIVTPHRSGQTPRYAERLGEIVLRNIEHFVHGEPLENLVDRQAGY